MNRPDSQFTADPASDFYSMNLPGEIGIVHTLEAKVTISDKPEDIHARDLDDTMANRYSDSSNFLLRSYPGGTGATLMFCAMCAFIAKSKQLRKEKYAKYNIFPYIRNRYG